jgi:hypothetical protein
VGFLAAFESRWKLIKEFVVDEFTNALTKERWHLPPEVETLALNVGGSSSSVVAFGWSSPPGSSAVDDVSGVGAADSIRSSFD